MRARARLAGAVLGPLLRGPAGRPAERALVALGHRFPHSLPARGAVVTALARARTGDDMVALLSNGAQLVVPATSTGASFRVFGTLVAERGTVELLSRTLRPGDVVLDVGANLGFYAFLAAPLIGNEGRVYAFEAQPDVVEYLRRSVEINEFGLRVHVKQTAVTDGVSDSVELVLPVDAANTGVVSLYAHEWLGAARLRVPAASLDVWAASQGVERVDVVKIDVEGAELLVLRGMEKLLLRARPRLLVVELAPDRIAFPGIDDSQPLARDPSAAHPEDVVGFLREHGYEPRELTDGGTLGRRYADGELGEIANTTNVAFVPATALPEGYRSRASHGKRRRLFGNRSRRIVQRLTVDECVDAIAEACLAARGRYAGHRPAA